MSSGNWFSRFGLAFMWSSTPNTGDTTELSHVSPSSNKQKVETPVNTIVHTNTSETNTVIATSLIKLPDIPYKNLPAWAENPSIKCEVKRFCQGTISKTLSSSNKQISVNSGKIGGLLGTPLENHCIGSALVDAGFLGLHYVQNKDVHGLLELSLRNPSPPPSLHCCSLCDPAKWIFEGSQYDSYLTKLYAQLDGCLPATLVTKLPKFIVPWRYKNKRTGEISWKIYHLPRSKITGAENEIIVVNPYRDSKLRSAIGFVSKNYTKYPMGPKLVEFLLKVVQETMGNYGLPGGSTGADADAKIFELMIRQQHNFVLLCEVEIGVCRHKALLFKILCDVVHLSCAVITGYSTAGRHQWNIITLPQKGDYLIDPTSKHFTWAKPGSVRTKGYKIMQDDSLGHAGFTLIQRNFK